MQTAAFAYDEPAPLAPLPLGFKALRAPSLKERAAIMPKAAPPALTPRRNIGKALEGLITSAGFAEAPNYDGAAATFARRRSSATCCTIETLAVRIEPTATGGHAIRVTLESQHSVVREFGNSYDWQSFTALDLDSAGRVAAFANLLNGVA